MAKLPWDMKHVGQVVCWFLDGSSVTAIRKKLAQRYGQERTADSITTVISKVFHTDQTKNCPIQANWIGQGMVDRVNQPFSPRERKRICQGHDNGMTETQLALATGRSPAQINNVLRELRPKRQQRKLF